MRKNRKRKTLLILLFLVLTISIGYALLSSNLKINGTTGIKKSTWNIHFANIKELEGSKKATNNQIDESDPTKLSYSVTLPKPGDFYEFNVDIVNDGTIDGMISSFESKMNGEILKDLPPYLEYSLTYNDGQEIKGKQALKSGDVKTITIRIAFKKDITEEILPTDEQVLSMEFNVEYVQIDGTEKEIDTKLCKRANVETLHTEVCKDHSGDYNACDKLYSVGEVMTYGNKSTTNGKLTSGDAFDCDVDGDGVYDSNTERFYYVSDYYDTTSKSFNSDYATFIYYNNVKGGIPNNLIAFVYDSSNENWHGPRTGYMELPSISQWSNVKLFNATRQLLNENAEATTSNDSNILGKFTYTDKASRLLTVQEVNRVCNISVDVGNVKSLELDKCEYLLENTWYSNPNFKNWWLESPCSKWRWNAFVINGQQRIVSLFEVQRSADLVAIRPAIDVAKTDINLYNF